MGEIKSTLDLVMERTRHLSLSKEEKQRQRKSDFEKRLQGLLQQYADHALRLDALLDRIDGLQAEFECDDRDAVVKASIHRVAPGQDNAPWLALLARLAPATCEPLSEILAVYHRQETLLMKTAGAQQRSRLASKQGIRGSALRPNLQKDASYQEGLAALQAEAQNGIASLTP
jgi:hypothetical protein